VSDERIRRLERAAKEGDYEATEELYWSLLRLNDGGEVIDRLLEAVLTIQQDGRIPGVWDKINWLRQEGRSLSEEQLTSLRALFREVADADSLHTVPREIREPGLTIYAQQQRRVFRYGEDHRWHAVARLSSSPPGYPFMVVKTLAERDALNVRSGASCLVLDNNGVYRSELVSNPFSDRTSIKWNCVRIERGVGGA